MYRSTFTSQALEDVKKLPKNVRNSLKREFRQKIHVHPIECSEPLSAPLEAFRSFHYKDYRVVYQVFQDLKIVAVVGIGQKDRHHHGEIYRRLEELERSGKLATVILDAYRSLSAGDDSTEE